MPKKSFHPHRECTESCSSIVHAEELLAAVTLPRSIITDKQLASYFKSKCYNFHSVCDEVGRKVLHMAASCGRKDLCLWLVKRCKVNIDDRDKESGYTALHRAILYGYIDAAVVLIQLGANLGITDREDLTPVDLILRNFNYDFISSLFLSKRENMKKSDEIVSCEKLRILVAEKRNLLAVLSNAFTTEVHTWGTNQNYTLGFGGESGKASPEYLELFEKKNEIIIDIQMQKYHTIFLSLDGNVWSCGLGQGGRLGLSSDSPVLIPQKIVLASKIHSSHEVKSLFCLKVAVGTDHSVFMCNDNQILTCGLNTYHQLGISPPPCSISVPQLVESASIQNKINGIAASTFHSVIWTCNTVYTCGLHAGQLGRPNSAEKTVPTFQKVHYLDFQYTNISHVAVSEAATVIVTDVYDIYLLSGYKTEKLDFRDIMKSQNDTSFRKHGNNYDVNSELYMRSEITVVKVAVLGGDLDLERVKSFNSSYRPEELRIAVLLSNGSLFLRRKNCSQFLKCHFLKKHEIRITDVYLNACNMLLCSYKGDVFNAQVQNSVKTFGKAKDDFVKVNHKSKEDTKECYPVKLNRIQSANRSFRVFSEPSNSNFGLLKIRSANELKNFPDIRSDTIMPDIESFFQETCEFDSFSDITFKVGRKSFLAHKYILASCSEEFSLKEGGIKVIENVNADIFEQLLLYIYTGTCCFLREGPCPIRINKTSNVKNSIQNSPKNIEDPIKLSMKVAQEFKITDYFKALRSFRFENDHIHLITSQPLPKKRLRFNRFEFKHLYDIKLKSQDGQIFHAHKCVLAARVEYFRGMLCGFWKESTDLYHEHGMPMSGSVLSEFLEFVYTDAVVKPIFKKDFNFWCSLLVAADQFILPKLVEICENAISQCLDTRNVYDVLLFADAMRAIQLKNSSYEFISINLASLLYTRVLENLNDTLLNELTEFYRNQFRLTENLYLCPLNVPVYSNACPPETVMNAETMCPIDWDVVDDPFNENLVDRKPLKVIQKKKKKTIRKPVTFEFDCVPVKEQRALLAEQITSRTSPVSSISMEKTPIEKAPTNDWMTVEKHLKSVKTRLKVNSIAKSFPQLVELKENFTPLGRSRVQMSPGEEQTNESKEVTQRTRTYSVEIDLQNITPKLSQKQQKKLRRSNESEKLNDMVLTQRKSSNENLSSDVNSSLPSGSAGSCWGRKNDKNEPVNFSAIVASEKKQKTMVQKETRKIETKPLHLTQIEDKAIQELFNFYNNSCSEEECIFVRRVIHKTAAPQWVIK